jgi:cob(I)alamin adenosyltransferase
MTHYYTGKGDDGYTGILGEGRVPKYHPRPEAVGTVDEATAALGMARASCKSPVTAELVLTVQRDLYSLMAEVSADQENAARFRTIDSQKVTWLEEQIDRLNQSIEPVREFIVPGDSRGGAAMAVARAGVRRAERRIAEMIHQELLENVELLRYLNRLSSLCFLLELLENKEAGKTESTLAKGSSRP